MGEGDAVVGFDRGLQGQGGLDQMQQGQAIKDSKVSGRGQGPGTGSCVHGRRGRLGGLPRASIYGLTSCVSIPTSTTWRPPPVGRR